MTKHQQTSRRIRNRVSTKGYFIKRLKDNGFIVWSIFHKFGEPDPRKWMILVDPGGSSVFVTCYVNKNDVDEVLFEFNDGGMKFPKNFSIKTSSMEVVVDHLLGAGVSNTSQDNEFYHANNDAV